MIQKRSTKTHQYQLPPQECEAKVKFLYSKDLHEAFHC